MVSLLNQNLAQKSITVTVTDEAKKWILNQTLGDRSYGARPLRRALQKYIEDPLSEALIQGTITTRPAFIEVFLDGQQAVLPSGGLGEDRGRAAVRELEFVSLNWQRRTKWVRLLLFSGSPSQSPMRSLGLSLLQFIEVAADHTRTLGY